MKPNGWLWIKTDHKPYFDQISEAVDIAGFERADKSVHAITSETFTSRFETHFTEQALPTYELVLTNPGQKA